MQYASLTTGFPLRHFLLRRNYTVFLIFLSFGPKSKEQSEKGKSLSLGVKRVLNIALVTKNLVGSVDLNPL